MNLFKRLFSHQEDKSSMSSEAVQDLSSENNDTESKIETNQVQNTNNLATNGNYVEFYFHACFPELFNIENSYGETDLKGTEIFDLFSFLNIDVDRDYIIQKFLDQTNSDVEVFHSSDDEQIFAYIDLEKDPTDQNDMFLIGVRCLKAKEGLAHQMLLEMYQRLRGCFTNCVNSVTLNYRHKNGNTRRL